MTMNIAFFSKHLPSDAPNGVSVQVDRLAAALITTGHRITCFSFSPRPSWARYDHVQLSWGGASRWRRKFVPAIEFCKVKRQAFDISHFHGDDYLCSGAPRRARTFYGSALHEALHAASPDRFFYQALFYSLEWVSSFRGGTLTGISRMTKRALPLISHVIPCGVPLDRFTPDPSSKSANPLLLFIGDFTSRKRGDLLLRVFRDEILPRFPACRLAIVGPESVAAANVSCLGRIDEADLIREYRKAWIYCLPSSYEGFGVPAIEAMACGTPVVACSNAGIREVIENGRTGVLCKPERLGESIVKLINDQKQRRNLCEQGLEEVKKYDMRVIAKRYEELYEKILTDGN